MGTRNSSPFLDQILGKMHVERPAVSIQTHGAKHGDPLHRTGKRGIGCVWAKISNCNAMNHAERHLLVAACLKTIEIEFGRPGCAPHRGFVLTAPRIVAGSIAVRILAL